MEYWDIYDENKQLTGQTMKKNDWILKPGQYHLSVLGIIQNKEGNYLITQRVMTKAWAPGWWEVPGGACMAGESSKEAVIREVKEETGLDVSNAEGGFVMSYHRENPGDNYFVDVYKFILDFDKEDVCIQSKEAPDFKLASLETMEQLDKEGIFLHFQSIKEAL